MFKNRILLNIRQPYLCNGIPSSHLKCYRKYKDVENWSRYIKTKMINGCIPNFLSFLKISIFENFYNKCI